MMCGLCACLGSVDNEATQAHRGIQDQIKKDREKFEKTIKLLLLGAGESGKSTIVKQMKILHMSGYSDDERLSIRAEIRRNVVINMMSIVEAMTDLSIEYGHPARKADAEQFLALKDEACTSGVMGRQVAVLVNNLWNDSGIQQCYRKSRHYQLNDSASYYFADVDRISDDNYVPTDMDILRCRVQTTGVVETHFKFKNRLLNLVDVGGQRPERRKWIYCFADVDAIIFITALSEYDLTLAEESSTNRMKESLKLFESIVNNRWFESTAIILFLNKTDLFREKLLTSPLQICFPEYTGTNQFEEAVEFIQETFESLVKNHNKTIYTKLTCATDTDNVRFVFDGIYDTVLTKNLQAAGLT